MAVAESTNDLISEHKVLTGFNRFMYFALAAIAINIIDSLLGPYKDYYSVYVLSGTALLLILSLQLYKKKNTLAAIFISGTTFNLVFILICVHIGIGAGTYLYYFPFILSYIYLFRAEGLNKYVLLFSIISIACLIFSLIVSPEDPPMFKVPEAKIKKIFILSFLLSFSLTLYFFVLIFRYQEKLYKQVLSLEKNTQKQQLRSLVEAQETNIQGIVHELRNNISQTLAASKFFLEEAVEGGNNLDLVSKSHGLTKEAMNALTMLCIKMHPAIITDVGFIDGTRQYIVELKRISPVQIQFDCNNNDIEKIDEKDKISIFRIIQDYLTIVLNNPGTTQVNIKVLYRTNSITITLVQNDPDFNFMKTESSINLSSFHNRITYFHGVLQQKKEESFETSVVELSLN
jgi:signal transduction histidine kinase